MSARVYMNLAASLGLIACGPVDGAASLGGVVLDTFGRPLVAEVQIAGDEPPVVSGADGRYHIPLSAGPWEVAFSAPGFGRVRRHFELEEATRVVAPPVTLAPIPPAPGLWLPGLRGPRAVAPSVFDVEVPGEAGGHGRVLRARGAPTPWCGDQPLLARWPGTPPQAPFVALWTDWLHRAWVGPEGQAAQLTLDMEPLGQDGYAIRASGLGVAMLIGAAPHAPNPRLAAYLLERIPCDEEAP